MISAPAAAARVASAASWTSTSAASPSDLQVESRAERRRSSSAPTISSAASAPSAAASTSWYSVTMKSLRRTGISTAARTAARWSGDPSKKVGSVSTEIAAAPAAAYAGGVGRGVVVLPQDPARRRPALALGDDAGRRGRASAPPRTRPPAAGGGCSVQPRRAGGLRSRTSTARRVAATIVSSRSARHAVAASAARVRNAHERREHGARPLRSRLPLRPGRCPRAVSRPRRR